MDSVSVHRNVLNVEADASKRLTAQNPFGSDLLESGAARIFDLV